MGPKKWKGMKKPEQSRRMNHLALGTKTTGAQQKETSNQTPCPSSLHCGYEKTHR